MLPTSVFFGILTFFARVGQAHAIAVPTAKLDNATVTGVPWGSINLFRGIPYGQPPTGNRRFRLPQALPPYDTDFSATTYGPACPQQPITHLPTDLPTETANFLSTFLINTVTSAEDCLNLDVVVPADVTPESKLPVLVWFFPGAFEWGGSSMFDGHVVVEKSIALGVPLVYVSINFRQNAFGFLASQEVKDAGVGNLGLQDQRLALHWVQKYISAFGGDPTKVTIWGYSSGGFSVGLQMVANGGDHEGLFRAGFMQGGIVYSMGDITNGQPYYDALVTETGCSGANDTLQCLREVPYDALLKAVNESPGALSYQSLHLAWMPRVDGVFLSTNPLELTRQGVIADIPFIAGNCDDEGTIFAVGNSNVTTDTEFEEYIKTYSLTEASMETIARVMEYYPSDPTKGSPYDTGYLNAVTPQFKRIASFEGDIAYHVPRRLLLQSRSGKQRAWTYLSKRLKDTPVFGSFHASDIPNIVAGLDLVSYLVRFVTNLDPNVGEGTDLYWPPYDTTHKIMLEFADGLVPQVLTTDTFRAEEIAYLTDVTLANPL